MSDTMTKKQNVRSQTHLHIKKIRIHGENERKYIENDLSNEINHIFP